MKRKLLFAIVALMCSVGTWADTDCTSSVGTAQANWTGATGTYTPRTLNVQMVERYSNDLTAAGTTVFTQTVTGLAEGTYNVVLYATANNARNDSGIKSDAQDIAYVYAGSDKSHKAYVLSHYQDAVVMPHIYALNNVTVGASGNLEIGMYTEKTGTQWQTLQIKSLTKVDAVAEPDVEQKSDVGGSDVSNTEAFTSIAATSTLEVGATAFLPIHFTNATEAFTYTPETTCTVRFVRTGGNIYVYEGTTYKGVVAAFTPTLYTTFAKDFRPTNTNQLLQNPDFETVGEEKASGRWAFGDPWTTNYTITGTSGIRIGEKNNKKVVIWRGTQNSNYFGQPLFTLKPNTQYRVMLEQVDAGNANATFYIGIGDEAGKHGLCEKDFKLGTNQNGVKNGTFTTPASIVNGSTYYFTFQNTSYNSASSGNDPVSQIDWISLEEPYTWGLTGVSSASYLEGTAYKPYTLSDIRSEFGTVYASIATTLNDDNYANVDGSEKTALETAYNTTYNGFTSEAIDDYETAIAEINNLIESFKAAKPNYDAFAFEKEIATNVGVTSFPSPATAAEALAAVNTLKVNEYTYVTSTYDTDGSALFIPSWEKDNFDRLDNEHWSGTTSEYFDKWSGSAFTSKIYKEVTLPEGHYAFYAAARGQAGASAATLKVSYGETNLSVPYNMKGNRGFGINTSGTADFSSSSTYACNNEGYGWEWRFITFDLSSETTVTLSIEGSGKNSWVSAGDTKLLTYDNIAVNRQQYEAALAAAQAYQGQDMFDDDKTALNNAIEANTLTITSATKDELIAATAALNAATEEAAADVVRYTTYNRAVELINGETNVDLTSLIVNPSFESDFTGWTNTGNMVAQTNSSFGKSGNKYVESWQPNGTKGVSQTVGLLPAGIYQLTLRAKARGVTSAKVFANSNEVAMTIEDKENTYNVTFDIADKTSINIGFEGVGTGASASWLAIDNFTLSYVGSVDDLTYTLAEGKMSTDKSDAQTTAEETFLANKNLANYNALLAAIAEAEVSVANYATLKTAIDKAQAVKDANNFVTEAATTTLTNEISTATSAWTDVTYTDAQCTDEIGTLGSTVSGWHAIANEGVAGAYIASTWGKNNENWWDAPYINTWSVEGDNDGSDFSVPFFEYYTDNNQNLAANTFTATLSGLDKGAYEVELWARVQRRSDADFNSDNSMITMSVNGGEAVSIMSNTENNVGSGTSVMRLGRYKAYGQVTDGTLTLSINVKLGANVHWLCWRDVKYTKLSDVTIDEASTTAPEAVAFANVTLTRTLSTEYWNTFCSPVDITADEINTLFGANSKVREMDTEATVADNTIPFKDATSIVAGVPYLVKPETEVKNPSFTGKTIVAEGQTVRNGEYKYIGILAKTTLAAPTNEATALDLYLSTTGTMKKPGTNGANLKGMRAYFNVPAAAANSGVKLFIDGETDAIDMIDGEPVAGAAIYNIAGQRVNKAQRGIYIINGKKVLVK